MIQYVLAHVIITVKNFNTFYFKLGEFLKNNLLG